MVMCDIRVLLLHEEEIR